MRRARRAAGGWSITPLGIVLVAILPAAVVLAAVGSASVQLVSFVVLVVDGGLLVGSGLSGGEWATTGKGVRARRAEFGPRSRRAILLQAEDPEQAWRRERERRDQSERERRSRDIGLS